MKNFKIFMVLNMICFIPALGLAEDSLQSAVISKVSAEHASDAKNGNFSRRQNAGRSPAARSATAAKRSMSPAISSRPTLIAKAPLHEKREANKRRARLLPR